MNSKYRILIVDDDRDVLEVAVETACSAGFQVLAASGGAAAIEMLDGNEVHAIVSDIRMPGMSGLELFAKTKARNIPTIFISGFSDTLDLDKALEMGASDFISKPFTSEELLNSIEVGLRADGDDLKNEPHDSYCRIAIDEFLSGTTTQHDVFIRLAETRFLRIARADSPLSRQRINSYRLKGLSHLYVRREDFAKYVDFNIRMARVVSEGKVAVPRERKMRLLKQTSQAYLENIYVNGVNRELFDEGRELVETTLRLITENDDVFTMLELLKRHSDEDYSQSVAIAIYSTLIAKELGWSSPQTLFRVAVAGLLHDIGTRSLPRDLMKKYRQDRISLSDHEIRVFQTHPTIGRNLLVNISCIPEEVPLAVLQHHENMAGLGYPHRPLRLKLHPFSRILNLADAFCRSYLDPAEGPRDLNPKVALQELFAMRESEFDPQMLRALFNVLNVPVPVRIANVRTHG
jgi:response regulator RpfG family c-di-GMP phosphodiesterase